MSDSMVIEPTRRADNGAKSRLHIGAWFANIMEALVNANRHRFDDSEALLYRFPPL